MTNRISDLPRPERYGAGRIVIREYDSEWPSLFEHERSALQASLGEQVIVIEHVGSTAVPGLASKPIIDLLVGVHDLAAARSDFRRQLETHGYTYMAEYETWLPDEMLFRKGARGPWTHHAHVMEAFGETWCDYIRLRDYLRRHSEIARAYGNVKSALALVFEDDIAGYRNAKRPFVERMKTNARADRDSTS